MTLFLFLIAAQNGSVNLLNNLPAKQNAVQDALLIGHLSKLPHFFLQHEVYFPADFFIGGIDPFGMRTGQEVDMV
jgi:hypothetical protein